MLFESADRITATSFVYSENRAVHQHTVMYPVTSAAFVTEKANGDAGVGTSHK